MFPKEIPSFSIFNCGRQPANPQFTNPSILPVIEVHLRRLLGEYHFVGDDPQRQLLAVHQVGDGLQQLGAQQGVTLGDAVEVATAYTFRFDVSNAGGTSITIEFNDTVETVELGDCELND